MIEKHHDRIVSLHLKDRTADGGNLPWGQGKTPIKQILQLMRKERWTFPADIKEWFALVRMGKPPKRRQFNINNPLNYWLAGLASIRDYTDNPSGNAEGRPVCRGFRWINRGSGK